jgi:hypothetical protein
MMFYFYIPDGENNKNNKKQNSTNTAKQISFRNIKVKHHIHLKMAM